MTEQERKTMMILADTIEGEINRMCVTDDLSELDTMAHHAKENIIKLAKMRYNADFDGKEPQYVFVDLKAEGDPLYYSILAYDKATDQVIDGFGTYDIKVLSGYLKKYFGLPKIKNK